MEKLWTGRFTEALDRAADAFNASIRFDSKMVRQDITGSMAHAAMLGAQGIISQDEADAIVQTLSEILADIESGKTSIDMSCEDIHMYVEPGADRPHRRHGQKAAHGPQPQRPGGLRPAVIFKRRMR